MIDIDWLQLLSRRTISTEPFALIFNVQDEKSRESLLSKMNINIKNMIRLLPNSRMKIEIDGSLNPIENVNKIVESIYLDEPSMSK